MEKFRKLGVSDHVLKTIETERFDTPTEIQEKSIPLVMEGKDVIAGASTGSGKTLAFSTGVVKNTEPGGGVQALVLTPTRELAEQVSKELQKFSQHKHLHVTQIYGGVAIGPQIDALRTADVVVGTPGRILDHLGRNTLNLGKVKTLVLDEADRMLDMGFIDDVERIIRACPKQRQTLFFSATITRDVARLAEDYMAGSVEVAAKSYIDPTLLRQVYYDVPSNLKFSLLVHLLNEEDTGLVMVFCNTRRNTDMVARNLREAGIDATAIHGGFTQAKRSKNMERFHEGKICVLVCTDVAARGLDIPDVSHVYNYDVPSEGKDYIHRIGRTARAGEKGKAITLLTKRDHDNFRRVLRDHSPEIIREEMPYVKQIPLKLDRPQGRGRPRRGSGPRNNRRPSRRRQNR